MNEIETLLVESEETNLRLDLLLTKRFLGRYSRTYFQKLIEEGFLLLNGEVVKKRTKPKEGDEIEIEFVLDQEIDMLPENIPLDILYEDQDILVINKQAGLVTHPAPGNWTGTFVNALLYHCKTLPKEPGLRPGIVHRLDKDTTGVLIAAKTLFAQSKLIEAFSKREVMKEYAALVLGQIENQVIEAPIGRDFKQRQKMGIVEGGRYAHTEVKVEKRGKELSLVKVAIKTGRTHQIRVHLGSIGHPVLGDALYGNVGQNKRFKANRQLLHARRLMLKHPITGVEMEFIAPFPADFLALEKEI